LQTDFNNILKYYTPWWSWFYSRNARMGQNMQINKDNRAHKQNQGQKPENHLNICRKKHLIKFNIRKRRNILHIIKDIYDKTIVTY
jgi:hypothetical protein